MVRVEGTEARFFILGPLWGHRIPLQSRWLAGIIRQQQQQQSEQYILVYALTSSVLAPYASRNSGQPVTQLNHFDLQRINSWHGATDHDGSGDDDDGRKMIVI